MLTLARMLRVYSMRHSEFFEDDRGRLSMTRLVVFLTWPPATWIVLNHPQELSNYLGAYVLGYALGKGADIFIGNRNAVADTTESELETTSDSTVASSSVVKRVSKRK